MTLMVANPVADSQVFSVAVTALTERLDMFQRCNLWQHMFTAYPARHHTVQLARYRFVNLVAGVG